MKRFKGRRRQACKNQQKTCLDLSDYDTCEICYGLMPKKVPDFGNQNIMGNLYIKIEECSHRFHKECLRKYLVMGEGVDLDQQFNSDRQYKCPMDDCKSNIGLKEIGIALQVDNVEKWIQRVLYSSYLYCKIDTCREFIEYDKRLDRDVQCPKCKIGYNAITQQLIPQALSQDELKIVTQYGYIKCHQCNFWIEKSTGCRHMTCRCGAQSCYNCGGVYGKCPCKGLYMDQFEEEEEEEDMDMGGMFD